MFFRMRVYVCIFGLVIPNLSKLYPSQSIYSKLKAIKYDTVSVIGYHEPSLVFLLKGNVILSNPNEGAIFLAEGKNYTLSLRRSSDLTDGRAS